MVKGFEKIRNDLNLALKKLATAKFDERLYWSYLFFVEEVMELYEDFVKALSMGNEKESVELANQIISIIELKYDEGFFQKTE